MTVRRERCGKCKAIRAGWQGSFGWKRFLPRPSQCVVSSLKRTCGQDQDAGGVRQTQRQCCKGGLCKGRSVVIGLVFFRRAREQSAVEFAVGSAGVA